MLVWGTNNIVIVIYPHFQAPALYIHNYDTIYTGLLLISLLLHIIHVHPLTNQCKLYYIEQDSIDKPSDF